MTSFESWATIISDRTVDVTIPARKITGTPTGGPPRETPIGMLTVQVGRRVEGSHADRSAYWPNEYRRFALMSTFMRFLM